MEGLLFSLLIYWVGSCVQKACLGLNLAAAGHACLLSRATNPSICAPIRLAPSTIYAFPPNTDPQKFESYREIPM